MKRFVMPSMIALLATSGCSQKIDPKTWTCASLVGKVIDMSKGKNPSILEITKEYEIIPHDEREISCGGTAEWSDGSNGLRFGAHISDGDQVIVEYEHP